MYRREIRIPEILSRRQGAWRKAALCDPGRVALLAAPQV